MSIQLTSDISFEVSLFKLRNLLLLVLIIAISYFIVAFFHVAYVKYSFSIINMTPESIAEYLIASSITLGLMYIESIFISIWLIEYRR